MYLSFKVHSPFKLSLIIFLFPLLLFTMTKHIIKITADVLELKIKMNHKMKCTTRWNTKIESHREIERQRRGRKKKSSEKAAVAVVMVTDGNGERKKKRRAKKGKRKTQEAA